MKRRGRKKIDGWKLFLLAPRMLQTGLYSGGATASGTTVLRRRMEAAAPRGCRVGVGHTTARNQPECELSRRAKRASALAHLGEVSAAAKALTAQPLAPANAATRSALRDPARHPPTAQVPIPPECRRSQPRQPVQLCRQKLLDNLRRARCGAAAGPSGCTSEHLRVLLDDEHTTLGSRQARARRGPA